LEACATDPRPLSPPGLAQQAGKKKKKERELEGKEKKALKVGRGS